MGGPRQVQPETSGGRFADSMEAERYFLSQVQARIGADYTMFNIYMVKILNDYISDKGHDEGLAQFRRELGLISNPDSTRSRAIIAMGEKWQEIAPGATSISQLTADQINAIVEAGVEAQQQAGEGLKRVPRHAK